MELRGLAQFFLDAYPVVFILIMNTLKYLLLNNFVSMYPCYPLRPVTPDSRHAHGVEKQTHPENPPIYHNTDLTLPWTHQISLLMSKTAADHTLQAFHR